VKSSAPVTASPPGTGAGCTGSATHSESDRLCGMRMGGVHGSQQASENTVKVFPGLVESIFRCIIQVWKR
jgi:hypothetical protein